MDLVCLDTMILLWGIKNQSSTGQEEMIPTARAFLQQTQKKGIEMMVPSVVIHELLAPLPREKHASFLEALGETFMIAPHDLQAARKSAEVWEKNGANHFSDLQEEHPALPFARRTIKIDCLLIGVALAQEADLIYSHDLSHVGKLARGFIGVSEMDVNLEFDFGNSSGSGDGATSSTSRIRNN